jgi:Tfp pilus assembly protein PilN
VRPVNLIPPEERRGASAPARSGPLAYAVIGLLAVVLVAVIALVSFNHKVSERQGEVDALEAEVSQTQARATQLADYSTFQQLHDARVQTVTQLATSRFDWERVIRELAKVIPPHVWLTEMVGTVSPEALAGGNGSSSTVRSEIPGPALELTGCGRSHSDVAELISAMKDIDGVTRVLVSDSTLGTETTSGTSSSSASSDTCQTRPSIAQFHLTAAFDGLTVATPPATTPPVGGETTTTSTDTSGAASTPTGGVTAAEQQGATGTPSESQQRRIDTGKKIAGAG